MAVRRTLLRVEELGPRTLPSGSPLLAAAPAAAARTATAPQPALAGMGSGAYVVGFGVPDAGAAYTFTGSAFFLGLGPATVQGSIRAVGFTVTGQARGTLTFTTARGAVTVALEGPAQPGFSPLPAAFRYQVVRGTGAFSHLVGQGTLRLALLPAPGAGPAHGRFVFAVLPS
jgi:hypothetical protein